MRLFPCHFRALDSVPSLLHRLRALKAAPVRLQINAGIAGLSVGRPEDDAVIVPVVSKASADFIEGLVKDAEAKGATLCQPYRREGNLIWPLLIDKARPQPVPAALPVACAPAACANNLLAHESFKKRSGAAWVLARQPVHDRRVLSGRYWGQPLFRVH